MDPIRLQDIPEDKIFDYFICHMCDRIIRYAEIETFVNCKKPVKGDVTILALCKRCDSKIQNEKFREFNQKRMNNMHYYLSGDFKSSKSWKMTVYFYFYLFFSIFCLCITGFACKMNNIT